MLKNTKKCVDCIKRIEDLSIEQDQMERYCNACKMLEKRRSEGSSLIPVYTMEQLAEYARNGLPILTRNGLSRLA